MQITWVYYVLVILVTSNLLDLVRLNLQPYISLVTNQAGQLVNNFVGLLIISSLIFKALRQPVLFDGLAKYEKEVIDKASPVCPSGEDDYHSIFEELERLILSKKLYTQPRLSLDDLAKETGLNIRDISASFNQTDKGGFCNYINRLRVQALKDSLKKQGRNARILDIALETGFNSKSSLNSIFKREVKMTPSQYLNSILSEQK
nr:helix-turn-helix transcriptional regulator [Aliikangiella sp. G2MR2-5]